MRNGESQQLALGIVELQQVNASATRHGARPSATRDRRGNRKLPPAETASYCKALLAELDRVAAEQQARAVALADLFDAVERANAGDPSEANPAVRAG